MVSGRSATAEAQIGRALARLFHETGIEIADRNGQLVAIGVSLKQYDGRELLPVGNYQVVITRDGFRRFARTGVELQVNVPARIDAVLQLGNTSQSVTVTESVPVINTTSPEIGRTIQNQEVQNMPLVKRNAYQLLFHSGGTFSDRVGETARRFAGVRPVEDIIEFIRADSNRGILHPQDANGG